MGLLNKLKGAVAIPSQLEMRDRAMNVLAQAPGTQGIRDLASQLAQFQRSNPDCNHAAMHATLIAFLREVAEADGVLDEREEMAIDRIDAILSGAAKV